MLITSAEEARSNFLHNTEAEKVQSAIINWLTDKNPVKAANEHNTEHNKIFKALLAKIL